MLNKKTALLTGISGQDASWLSQILINNGYKVYGGIRRTSNRNFERLSYLGLTDKIEIVELDLLDYSNIFEVIRDIQPDEFYNLAAQSFVPVSFKQPISTYQVNAMAVGYILDILKTISPKTKFLQTSTSEMYGKVNPIDLPLKENSPFHPRSPYSVAKLFAHWATINYKESYDMFCCSAISFNHECIHALTPITIRKNSIVKIVTPRDLVPLREKSVSKQTYLIKNTEIWDGKSWVKLKTITATKRNEIKNYKHKIISLQTRSGIIQTTLHHNLLTYDDEQILAENVKLGQKLKISEGIFSQDIETSCSLEFAELLGLLCSDGHISQDGFRVRFTNNDQSLRDKVKILWKKVFCANTRKRLSRSGFSDKTVHYIEATGINHSVGLYLRNILYARHGYKKVPEIILNGNAEVREAFLCGHYLGDGLKKGNGKSVKTNSPYLAQGLYWLYKLNGINLSIYSQIHKGRQYFLMNLKKDSKIGRHLLKPTDEVRKLCSSIDPSDWVYDLETESGYLQAGIGGLIIHNSELRGPEFVTRKISMAVAECYHGKNKILELGNIDAVRDWSYAKEICQGIFQIMQQEKPDTYVLASGKAETVRKFVESAYKFINREIVWEGTAENEKGYDKHTNELLVGVNPKFYRPAEVNILIGDASKAYNDFGWKTTTSIEKLAEIMVQHDVNMMK